MTGGTPARSKPEYFDGNIKWLVSGDVHRKQIFDCEGRISNLGMQNSNARNLPVNSVIIALNGQGKTRGTVAMLRTQATCNQSLVSITPKEPDALLAEFIFLNLQGRYEEVRRITGDAGNERRGLNMRIIRGIEIPFPPLEEQRRIVAVLDEAFEGLDRARAHVEGNLQNGQDLFVNWYANVFESVSSLNSVQTILVKDLALPEKGSIRTGPFGSQLLHSEFVEKGIVVLGIDNAVANEFRWGKRRFITSEKYDQIRRFTVHPGDVIITIMGTCGRCAIIPEDMPTAINTKHLCCISLDQEKCLPEYLHRYFLRSPVARSYLSAEASGSVMDGLNMGIIKNMPVTLPSIDKQRELIESFAEVETCTREVMARYEAQGNDLNDLRQSLLQRAFAGELT